MFYNSNKFRISLGGNVIINTTPLNNMIYIEGTYSDDKKGIEYKKTGIAENKVSLIFCSGISVPLNNNIFWGYKMGLAEKGYSFDDNDQSYVLWEEPSLSQQIELGICPKNTFFFVKGFTRYDIGLSHSATNSFTAGVAIGIPYGEIGFVMDNLKTPSLYLSAQISFSLE